jgi:hypothetical protein
MNGTHLISHRADAADSRGDVGDILQRAAAQQRLKQPRRLEDMKRNGGFVPGVKPGKATADFLDNIMSKITLPGALALAFVAILPAFAVILGVNTRFAQFFGGTSLFSGDGEGRVLETVGSAGEGTVDLFSLSSGESLGGRLGLGAIPNRT